MKFLATPHVVLTFIIMCTVMLLTYHFGSTFRNRFRNTPSMSSQHPFIVQYVGFETPLDESVFIARWSPFASNFKRVGIKQIDLYKVSNNNKLNYVSRNVWAADTYFQNFPNGMAGAGGGGGISVSQLGGYWIDATEIEKSDEMYLIFSNTDLNTEHSIGSIRNQCSESVPFTQMMEVTQTIPSPGMSALSCVYLKTF